MIDDNDQGLFWDGDNERFPGASFIGAPELGGDRSVFQTHLSARLELDFMDDQVVRRDGARIESYFKITGPWMPLNDGSADYILSRNTLNISKTLFSVRRESGKSWMSFVFDNDTTYRYIIGDKIPQYLQGGDVWDEVTAPATTHALFHTMADMASIQGRYLTTKVSLVSSDFDWNAPRFYLNDHNEAVPYAKTGLREEDFEVFDRYGVKP